MAEGKRLRLFVALDLPDTWRATLARESAALEASAPGFGRWVNASLMHITLVFLGGQPAEVVPEIENAVKAAGRAARPFELRLHPLGCFGGRRSVRVVWAGANDTPPEALSALHSGLTLRLTESGISFDSGPLRPHITLARARRGASAAQSEEMFRAIALRNEGSRVPLSPDVADCDHVVLMRSDLKPTGPVYTPMLRTRLGEDTC